MKGVQPLLSLANLPTGSENRKTFRKKIIAPKTTRNLFDLPSLPKLLNILDK
jgi:hypothetical protein